MDAEFKKRSEDRIMSPYLRKGQTQNLKYIPFLKEMT
jgi:hypothetical protein